MIRNTLWFLTIVAIFALSFSLLVTAQRLGRDSRSVIAEVEELLRDVPETAKEAGREAVEGAAEGLEDVALRELDPATHIKRGEDAGKKATETLKKEADPRTHVDRAKKIFGL